MKKCGFLMLMIGVVGTGLFSCKQVPSPKNEAIIPVEDFFRNPDKDKFRISPNGEQVAFVQSYHNRMNLFTQNLSSKEVKQLSFDTTTNISGFSWANDSTLLFLKDSANDQYYHVYSVSVGTVSVRNLTPFPKTKAFFDIQGKLHENIFIYINKRRPDIFDAYKLDLKTGNLMLSEENADLGSERVYDNNGLLRVLIQTDGVNRVLRYRSKEQNPFKVILVTNFRESLVPIGFDKANRYLYCISNLGRDKNALVLFDPESGKEIKTVYENPNHSLSYYNWFCKKSCTPAFTIYRDWKARFVFFNDSFQNLFSELYDEFPAYELSILNADDKEENFVVRTYTAESPGAYYVYNTASKKLDKLGDVAPWLNENALAKVKPFRFKSRDGLLLNAYLTMPRTVEAKNLPLIVFPHSFFGRNNWEFNPEAQFFASRGYAVLQVNYRGTSGYGKAFSEAGYKQWGQKMQTDLDDGVMDLIRQEIVDSNRIAIFGFDYGGFAALNGLIQQPDLYRCAVDYCGYTNMFTFIRDIPPYFKQYLEMIYLLIGHPEKDADMFRKISPAFHIDKIKAPLLIAQGGKDQQINTMECNALVKDMQKRGIDVTYFFRPDEGHGFRNEENKMAFYKEVEVFLAKHLKAD